MEARQILAHARMVEAAFAKRLIEHQLIPSLDPDIHFAFFEQGYGVVESKTRTAIRLV